MGRGQIVSGGEDGRYQVKLIYAYRSRITARLNGYTQQMTLLDQKITAIDVQIAAETDAVKKAKLQDTRSVMVLQRASIQKLHDYYSTKMPADPTISAWCADKTEDLAAGTNVGTIEIPGEPSTVLVRPAYNNRSVYTAARDGNLMPSIAGSPHQVLFNWMLLPGWQRHKPIYRAGTIVPDSLDFDNNTCSVCLDPAYSSQQNLPAVNGIAVSDCNMGDDDQSEYLTSRAEDFCSRNPSHPLCTQSPGSEVTLTDGMLAQLRDVNYSVNTEHGRANDKSGAAVGDSWDVMGPGQSGDCVACYEEIYTVDGVKKVGDLEVGDIVMSYDFNAKEFCYKPIVKIWEKGELPAVRVGLKNGHHIDITENHPLWARTNQGHGRKGKEPSRYAKKYFRDIDLSRWWLRRLPIAKKIEYQVKDIEWLNQDLCFIAGHFLAEGWIEPHKVSTSGYDIPKSIAPLLVKNSVPFSEFENSSGVPCIRFLKGKFKEFLKTLKSGSFDIHLPEYIFHLPENKLDALLNGFYLGDGHDGNYSEHYTYESHKRSVYSTSSERFAYDLQRIGLQLGKSFHLWKQEHHQGAGNKPIFRITHNLKSAFYADHGYDGISEVGIARNRISKLGKVSIRDFEVADTHTFIFKNGLICHQCEDFALTKMQMLVSTYGWNPNSLNIVTAFTKNGEYHAMLGVRTKNRGLVILDVNYNEVMESGRVPYRIDKIALASDDWKNYARKLESVPISYMGCDAMAFADGDRVIVEFTEQKWTQPKVVGFVENPQSCMIGYIAIGQYYDWYLPHHVVSWDDESRVFVLLQTFEIENDPLINYTALASSRLRAIRFAGESITKTPGKPTTTVWNEQPAAFFILTNTVENKQQQNINVIWSASYQQNGSAFHSLGNDELGTVYESYNGYSEKYTYVPDSWSYVNEPPYVGLEANAFSVSGISYVVGGETYFGNLIDAYSYRSTENAWSAIHDGGMALCRHAAFSAESKGYCMLGYDDNGSGERVDLGHHYKPPSIPENIHYSYYNYPLREYDPLTDSWSNKTMGPASQEESFAGRFDGADGQGGLGYIASGDAYSFNSYLDMYNPRVDAWDSNVSSGLLIWSAKNCSCNE